MKHVTKMTTIFITTLKPFLFIGKALGLIDISYTLESTGFLVRNTTTTYYAFLELTRMSVLVVCTYIVHTNPRGIYSLQQFHLIKFWIVIAAARLSESHMIMFINGIIKFDQKIALLSPVFMVHQRFISKTFWNIIFTSSIIYFIGYEVYSFYLWPPETLGIVSLFVYFFNLPNIIDFTVIISTSFYLGNLGFRFQTINDFWKRLPDGLMSVPGEWTHTNRVMLTESIRLLHAELSELLKMFSLGYGPMLLGFLACSFIEMIYILYIILTYYIFLTNVSYVKNCFKFIPLSIYKVQTIICMISIVMAASWINKKRNKMILYLRLNQISNLPVDLKIQIKMFMNQMLITELDEINAFGFFNINLNLITSILILLMTGIAVLIQLQNHPIFSSIFYNTESQ